MIVIIGNSKYTYDENSFDINAFKLLPFEIVIQYIKEESKAKLLEDITVDDLLPVDFNANTLKCFLYTTSELTIVKGFFHGRGKHSKGFDGYVLCGVVNSEFDIFTIDTYKQFSQLQNFRIDLKVEPTQEELDAIIAAKVLNYQNSIDNPDVYEEPDSPEIAKLKELGFIDVSVKKRSVLELDINDKSKVKTAPMQKLESTIGVTTPYALVDDFVENELTDAQQTALAVETAKIKGGQ